MSFVETGNRSRTMFKVKAKKMIMDKPAARLDSQDNTLNVTPHITPKNKS